jgi:serine protease
MKLRTHARRWVARVSTSAMVVLAMGAGTPAMATAASATRAPAAPGAAGPSADPYSPAFQHPYRHGVVPTRATATKMHTWAVQHPGAAQAPQAVHANSAQNLRYGGGVGGIGVTTGHENVYLVFWGSQWGTQGTDSNGNFTYSGDPSGEAPYLQQMFKGLGTSGEKWSGVMTQYCEGVSAGAQSCPSSARHVAYPKGGVLAGVWLDGSSAAPAAASAFQLGTEAADAAAHFGNTTAAANRDAQYVILSPTGTDPDHYLEQGFCAWHDWNGDPYVGVSSPFAIAFTNFPYVTDVPQGQCGTSFVNAGSAGALDGVSIVEGHEYAETITDQNPAGGWTDTSQNENADKCAWILPGTSGGAGNLSLATGTFAMQGTWANDGNSAKGACEFTHSVVSTQLLKNPGFESGKLTPWSATSGVLKKKSSSYPAHSGSWLARLDGRGTTHTDTLAQKVTVAPPNGAYTSASFSFWLETKTNDPSTKAYDKLTIQVLDAGGNVLTTLATYSNKNATSHYVRHSFSLNAYAGQTITIKFTGKETLLHHNTSFFVDDNALNAS